MSRNYNQTRLVDVCCFMEEARKGTDFWPGDLDDVSAAAAVEALDLTFEDLEPTGKEGDAEDPYGCFIHDGTTDALIGDKRLELRF